MILILEDNAERVWQFYAVIETIAPGMKVKTWASAHTMIEQLADWIDQADLISLDHDLTRPAEAPDPGDGYQVAKILAELIPICPVIIHTSNGERGTWMEGVLEGTGWQYERVYPVGDDWIAREWAKVAKRLMGI